MLPARPMWRPGERTTAAGAQPGCITKPFVNISAPSRCPGHDAKKPPLRTAGAFLPKRLNRKPGSVLNDDLSRLHVAMQLQPPPGTRRARIVPIWALLLVGFTEPRKSPSALVRSYRTFPPFPAQNAGSLFLLHYPWGHPRLPLAVTIPCEARTFLRTVKAAPPPYVPLVFRHFIIAPFWCLHKRNLQSVPANCIIQGNLYKGERRNVASL